VGCKGEAFSLLLIEGWDWDPARGTVRIIKSQRPAAGNQRKRKIEMSTERHWEGHGRAAIPGPRLGDTQPTGRGSAESLGCCDWMDSRQRRDVICASESVIPKPGSPPRPLPLSLFLRLLLLAGAPPAGRIRTTRRQPRSIMRRRCPPKWPIQRPPPGSSSIPAEIAADDPRIWPLQTAARHQTKGKKQHSASYRLAAFCVGHRLIFVPL